MSLGLSNSSISSSDAIRQALINEIEESLSQASKNQLGKTKIPESVFRICNDKDFEITNDVLEVAMKFGLDPTFRDIDENSSNKSNQLNSSNFPEGNQDYSLIQQQIYGYLLTVDLIEIGLITQEEEDEDVLDIHNSSSMSSLDKVRSLNFPKNMFDSLLLSFKSTRPALHRLLTQQIIFNNSSKPKRKKSRKDKRKDKKEKRVLDLSSLPSIIPNISPIMNPDISIPPMHYETDFLSYEDRGILLEDVKSTFSREDHLKDKISLYICKCLAEGTVTSYMCAVVYLTHLWKSRNDVIDELPLGNVIASLFEIGNENVAANKFKQKSLSPLSALLLSKETIANRAKAIEPSKTMDIHIFRESSEHSAGTVIEKDNETVVEDTDNNMIISSADEEISEEEMLAQALALSLTNVEATLLPVDSLIETNNSVVATLVETAMDTNNETEKENLVETGPKAWLTVPCSQIILPNTGIYEFKFRIDKCDRGQVFVGCMTVENSIGFKETCYLGIDKQSWGLMGNSSLWHNKSKVQSDYSNGFSSRSIIILKYDSNTSTVSYTVNGTDSDVAFSSLPEEPMYIAVTLHDKDDRITLLSVKKVSSQNTKRTTDFENPNDNIYNVYSSTIPFIRYSQIMFTYIDKMLIKVQSLTSSVDISILLSHPFISIFLTSLLAAINISNFSTCQGNLLAFQLLPYLTIVSRRLVEIIESTSNILTYSSIIPIVSSIWKFHRENVSAYKSDYLVNLSNNIDQTNIKTSKTAIAIQLSGKKIEKPDLNIVGTSYGNRIKYIEEWDSGSFNVVEGRISLCGTMITGKYIDLKGCATSPSIGTLISGKCLLKPENFHPNTYNYKFQINRYTHILTQLCLRGCSRLSGTFISGIPMPVSQDSIFSNEMDVVDETLPSSGESDLSERDGDESISPANNLSNSSEIDKWMQSNLLSNGSYLTDDIISVFIERTRIYSTCVVNEETVDNTKFNTAAIAETLNPKYAYTGLINWWLERNLPVLQASISENKFKRNNFFTQIMSNSGIGGSLDEYLILHTNQTMLTKLGGSIVQTTRRYILSVLIIHSGCLPLCLAQIELIEKNKTNLGTLRPSVILLNVWKACQRIIEHIFRQKQSSGLSYSSICKLFIEKSEFLINIQSSSSSIAVHDSLLALSHEMVQKETLSAIPSESSNDIIQDSNKLISEISDFYLSNIRDMKLLTKTLLDNTIVGISRIVGLKSYMFMINKLDDLPSFLCGNSSRNYFSSVSSINFQTSIIDFITLSLYGFNDTANAINSTISSTISYLGGNEEESNKSISGHYLHNLNGLPSALLTYLQTSFESVYEFITQLLSRCTWACDYDGQYITLASWSITITPSDHQFLNRVGIFRILQTLLDDVRVIYTKNINIQSTELKELVKYSSAEGPFANDFIISTNMRLSQLALKIMYSLASQVAYIKDANTSIIAISPTAAPKLQRSISGPDTLSLSLFEMLYSELFNGMKRLMKITLQESADNLADVANINQSKAKNFTPIEGSEDSLDGEGYIGRILKLLYYVSSSKTCHHSLSSGRWFSLLISSIGCGSLSTQRRVFRLLRRLLSNTQPNDFKAYITSIFHDRDDFILSENPLDEEDINALISLQSDDSMQIDNENEKIENSTTLIQFLVEAMTVIQPTYLLREVDEKKKNLKYNLIRYYQNSKISNFIAAESLVVIRVLQGIPAWRAQINKSLLSLYLSNKVDSDIDLQNSINQSSYSKIQLIISIFGVIGGHIDRFRPGGIVSIKPYTLASQSDTLANRLASMSHTSGMFVWQSASGESIEVVLMERGINVVKQTNETKDKLVHFTTSVNGTLPVRGVRLNASDVYPSYDVPGLPEFVSPDLFLEGLVPEVMNSAIPWLINHYTNCKSATILSENANAPETQLNKKINRWVRNDVVGHDNAFNNMDYADYDENEEHDVGEQNFPEPVARIDRKLNRWVHVDQITRNNTYNMDYIDFHDEQHDLLMDFPDPAEDVERVPPKPDSDLPLNDSVKPVEVIEEKKIVEPIKKGKEEDNDAEALKCFSRVSSLKALSLSMQNFDLVSIIIENHSKGLIDMLKLSLVQIPGSLQSIESIEERWVSYCESYCSFAISSDGPVITKPSNDADSNSSASPENMEVVRPNPTREGSASRLAEAAAAVFSSYSSRNIDPAAKAEAIAQMMDMGLPKEWCETALRRCRYNVEMAINMCFEHGDDMTRFVAEDNLAQSAISSRERDIFYRSGRKPSSGADEPSPLPSDYVSMSSLARVLVGSRSTTRRDPPSDPNSAIRQLLEMGFPPSWCARAMDASSNDVAGALGWILSHGEELSTGVDITSAPLKPTNLTSNIENQSDLSPNTSSQETITIINPLVSVSGSATVSPDLTCAVADEGFPSVGCRQFPVNSGKWYYEVVLHSSGCIQIGWVDLAYAGVADSGQGVGDDIHSWAYDGWRTHLWHEISTDWGGRWSVGDVVGCAVDLDNNDISFYLNGFGLEIGMGLAYSNIKYHGGIYPCISFNKREKVQFNFGSVPFHFPPPEDNPLCESVDDDYHSSFNWEAISGKIFSNNDDWLTMTGTIRQEELKGFTPIDGRIPERTDFPPELLIGCKVCRLCPVDSSVVEKEINDDEMLKDEPSSDDKPLSPTKEDSPQSPPEPKYEIGTVIGISSWPDDDVGTARVIKWSDGSTETVKWGVNGCEYDVTHVKVIDNKIKVRYANPIPLSVRILNTNFKSSVSFGVIVRLRKQNRSNDDSFRVTNRLVGVMEWPDFNAVVYVKGFEYSDKTWELIDYKLLSGPRDTTWSIRFGKANWMPGSIYKFQNSLDELTKPIIGSYTSAMICGKLRTTITGYISIQKQRLFLFDNKFHSSNITPSWDYLSVNKSISTSGQGCAFGNVGFSSGIHYWEFKIEQAEVGSIFIGVSEKPGSPGLSNSSKCIKWMGCGFVSDRTSYKSGSEKISVYGDHFHTGDLIGVLLDMNKGRLSFFLDGMKYGEHTLSDLGEAFDGLSSPTKVKPKTLYPVVGLSRYQDRVTITPRWLSTIGCTAEEELFLISKAWKLLTSWSFERPSSKPLDMNLWIYKDAWRDWIKWIKNQSMKIKTRCKVANMVIDISPRSCVVASLYLGLPMALFHGDHVVFDKSSGRKLETKEEVVILGVYNNQLWYRQDSQQEGKYVAESTAVAWALTQSDVEGLAILRRSYVLSSSLPVSVVNLPLPRLPMFRGGLVTLILQSGAAMRNGLEIDTSDVLREIAPNTVVFATEKRVNTSNIARYHIYYDGAFGWISERMRGGAEEVIVHVNNHSIEEIEFHKEIVIKAALELGYTARITWEEVNSLDEAMAIWELRIKQQGYSKLFERGNILYNSLEQLNNDENLSFEKYLSLSTTIDGEKNWSVEADMQLAEVLTKCAAKQGVIPQNLTYHSLLEVLSSIDVTTSLLHNVDLDRAIARAALLRTSNQVISYALPFLNLTLFEEKMHRDVYGSENEIEINPTSLPKSLISEDNDSISLEKSNVSQWQPPSWGRRLRSMRRVLFSQTKRQFWESILDHTTTLTPLHQDEYEDPREIKSISINRIKATVTKLVGVNSVYDRLRQSVFGQLHKELRSWSDGSFRRSYVGKGHGGQKRAFKVKFLGEGVNDYGGPYRAVFEQIIDELQCDRVVSKSTEKCLLPLFTPSNNRLSSVGSTQDKFLLAISPAISSVTHELMNFFGKLLGTAVRHNLNLALDLSVLVWRPLVKLPLSLVHLETVDSLFTKSLDDITKKGLQLELDYTNGLISQGLSYRPEEWEDLNFTAYLPDGSRVPLIPNGDDEPVNLGNWRNYVRLVEKCRLSESLSMFKALRDGLQSVLPTELLSIFTPGELEQIISGTSTVDVSLLKQCTEYEDISPDSPVVQNFWKVLDEFTAEDKTLFLRFVWARSRMPTSAQDLSMNFKLQGVQGDAKIYPDKYLPHAQTCFFSLSLPLYSTKEILKEKLLYAIHNSPNMDADVRLHNADGWADA
eukprot:gene17758-23358_t